MKRIFNDRRGIINPLVPALISLIVLFLISAGFAGWAYMDRGHYKNDADSIAATAVDKATKKVQAAEAEKYAEAEKKPYDRYVGPGAFGNVTVSYPKTWSAYVIENQTGGSPVSGYFNPGFVPSVQSQSNSFATRVELVRASYDSVLNQFKSNIQQRKVTAAPYVLPKVPNVVGTRIDGQITPTKQGTMIVLPLRDMTLKIWTESNDFKADLETHILPNLTFQP